MRSFCLDTFEILRQIIADKYERDVSTITAESTLETLELDSLDAFEIIFVLEEKFDIKVPNERVPLNTLQDVVNLIDKARAAQGK